MNLSTPRSRRRQGFDTVPVADSPRTRRWRKLGPQKQLGVRGSEDNRRERILKASRNIFLKIVTEEAVTALGMTSKSFGCRPLNSSLSDPRRQFMIRRLGKIGVSLPLLCAFWYRRGLQKSLLHMSQVTRTLLIFTAILCW